MHLKKALMKDVFDSSCASESEPTPTRGTRGASSRKRERSPPSSPIWDCKRAASDQADVDELLSFDR